MVRLLPRPETGRMQTLRIEHPITDFAQWRQAFDAVARARKEAGVRSQRVLRPTDDDHYVLVDLDFDTVEQATAFLGFLRTRIWSSPASSPALAGDPVTRLLSVEIDSPAA
jgi:hypothetical protein